MHLFACVRFYSIKNLQSWKKVFPNPADSPARYAKTLTVGCSQAVAAVDAEAGGWIRGFSHVVHFAIGTTARYTDNPMISFVPFHGFSAVVKSLRVDFPVLPCSQAFNLAFSFPLLEDLAMIARLSDGSNRLSTVIWPSSPPMLTGSLELYSKDGMEPIACRLLSLPGGVHFRKLNLTWFHKGDILLTTMLIAECSDTLESLDITWDTYSTSVRHLYRHQQLTPVPRRVDASFNRPLESDKTQRRSFSARTDGG
jgi:hypothetical protein